MTSTADIAVPAIPALDAHGLARSFGQVVAVDGIDLAIPVGSIFGLLGPDGAGKSTLIRMLATVLPPDAGDAAIFGESVVHAPRRVTPRIGYVSQQFSMYPDLTVAENLEFFATIRAVPARLRAQRAASLLESMGLTEFADRQAQHLSGGMKQKLMLASTLMHEPDLLLLDEPTTGVDPVSRREFWRVIAGLRRAGKTVLVATPYMDEAERCTDIAFMDGGRIRHRGTPAEVKALVPGRLYEVAADNPRAALGVAEKLPGIASAHLFGEVVRMLVSPGGPDDAALTAAMREASVASAVVRPASIDMETVFAYLAEGADAGDSQATSTDDGRAAGGERS